MRLVIDLLHAAVSAEFVGLRKMVAIFFPVMLRELVESGVGFLVLAAFELALVLVLFVMLLHVLQKLVVAHLCLAFGNLRTHRSFAFEPSLIQVLLPLLDLGIVFFRGLKRLTAGEAIHIVILEINGSAGFANRVVTLDAVFWLKDREQAGTTVHVFFSLFTELLVLKRFWNLGL